jgi:ribosome-interacting GTPase 1
MPANLPPEYHEIEKELRTARTPQEKIDIYERLIAVIPHHKGTDKLIAMYRAKIAKAREETQRRPSTAKHGPTHKVEKSGAGQVVLVGPPNSGKSLLVKTLTGADPEVADYPFTTRLPSPFMMPYENVKVQLVDTPPVTADYMDSWFPELVKAADAALFVADLADPDTAAVLDAVIRRLKDRKVDFVPAGTDIPPARFPFLKRALVAANKLDAPGAADNFEDLEVLLETPLEKVPVSAVTGRGLEELRRRIYELLRVIRVYSKVPGKKAETEAPFTLRRGITVIEMARAVHKDFAENLAYARVWSRGGGIEGLRVNRDHVLSDEDVVELHI